VRTELEAKSQEGVRRARTGDREGALRLFAQVVREAPREASFGPLVSEAIIEAPAGWTDAATSERLRQWLAWAVEHSVVGEPALRPRAVARLMHDLELSPALAAAAALVAGQADLAAFHERLADRAPGSEWLPYVALRAVALAANSPAEVARHLERAPAHLSGSVLVQVAWASLGLSRPKPAGEPAWEVSGGGQRLALFAPSPSSGLEIQFPRPAGGGAPTSAQRGALEVRLDGHLLDAVEHQPGQRVVIASPIEGGAHLLEILPIAGAGPSPGRVSLLARTAT